MRLVYDVEFVPRHERQGLHALAQLPHFLDAAVRRGVHLVNILLRGPERARQNARHGCFARTAPSGKKVRVRNFALLYGGAQYIYDMLVALQLVEAPRPVCPIQRHSRPLPLFRLARHGVSIKEKASRTKPLSRKKFFNNLLDFGDILGLH